VIASLPTLARERLQSADWQRMQAEALEKLQLTLWPSSYTSSEVRCLLGMHLCAPHPDRVNRVRVAAARPGEWVRRIGRGQAWQIGRYADRLPAIVALYSAGVSFEEIGRRYGAWTPWVIERALDIACACIAGYLNESNA